MKERFKERWYLTTVLPGTWWLSKKIQSLKKTENPKKNQKNYSDYAKTNKVGNPTKINDRRKLK